MSFNEIKKVSVVIPVYNEEESLPQLLERTIKACQSLKQAYEIVLVDDGSRDRSAEMLTQAAEIPENHVVAVLLNRNYGQHSAIMAGFRQAGGDLVITMDADLQNPPEEIPRLVEKQKRAMTWSAHAAQTVRTLVPQNRLKNDQQNDHRRNRQRYG